MIDRRALLGAGIAAMALPRVVWARNAGPLDLAYVNGRIWTGAPHDIPSGKHAPFFNEAQAFNGSFAAFMAWARGG